jgi:hypothetical protein
MRTLRTAKIAAKMKPFGEMNHIQALRTLCHMCNDDTRTLRNMREEMPKLLAAGYRRSVLVFNRRFPA